MYGWWGRWLRPALRHLSRPATQELARLGGLFLGLQMAMVVAFASDNLIVARLLGVEAVPDLAVPFKLFGFVPMLLGFVMAPLWPAYGDAIAKRDFGWIKKTLKRSLGLSIAISAAASSCSWAREIGSSTSGRTAQIGASMSLLLGLAAWTMLSAVGTAVAMLLNAAAVIKFQLVTAGPWPSLR